MIIHTTGALSPFMTRRASDARAASTTPDALQSKVTQAEAAAETKAAGRDQATETENLLKALRDYIDKGPIVALREKLLKSMNLTEDKLKALPPEQQNTIETEIARKIKEFLLEQQDSAHRQPAPTHAQAKLLAYQTQPAATK